MSYSSSPEKVGLVSKIKRLSVITGLALVGYGLLTSEDSNCDSEVYFTSDGRAAVCYQNGHYVVMYRDGGELQTKPILEAKGLIYITNRDDVSYLGSWDGGVNNLVAVITAQVDEQ